MMCTSLKITQKQQYPTSLTCSSTPAGGSSLAIKSLEKGLSLSSVRNIPLDQGAENETSSIRMTSSRSFSVILEILILFKAGPPSYVGARAATQGEKSSDAPTPHPVTGQARCRAFIS